MQEVIADKGMAYGRVSPLRTIATMEVGETWVTATEAVNPASLRVAASRYGTLTGKRFSIYVNVTGDIEVKRVL